MPTSTQPPGPASASGLRPIAEIARDLGLGESEWLSYGRDKAKVLLPALAARRGRAEGKLVVVTSMTPTPAGEGKTVTVIGLGQALRKLGMRPTIALRQPSIGPTLGIKGGGTGGGRSLVVPMEDINLHFTGDLHAVASAHNLLAAALDNHLHHGNVLHLDPRQVLWRRVLDMNDRALRHVVLGLGGAQDGVPRESGFLITAASEIMAVLCLAEDAADLKARLARILVAFGVDGHPVVAEALGVTGAMAALLRDAIHPNLVQSLEGVPAFVHGGPFANIAHGCNSVVATRMALAFGEIALTEAGFGADLGAEKFFDIKCRQAGLRPDAAVIVASVRALKWHGGIPASDLGREDPEAVRRGLPNLEAHLEIVRRFGVPALIAVNRYPSDTAAEHRAILERCAALGLRAHVADVFDRGGEGGLDLARGLVQLLGSEPSAFAPLYPIEDSVTGKLEALATWIYGADGVSYTKAAERQIEQAEALGYGRLPVCVAKTQRSLSDDPDRLGRPRGFRITVQDVGVAAGAGFLVASTGDITTMPGLPRRPNAERVDLAADGTIAGLF